MEKIAGPGRGITRGWVLNTLILNSLLGIEVEKPYSQFIIYDQEISEKVWLRDINWGIVSV